MARPRQEWSSLNPLIWLVGVVLFLYFARPILIPLALALTLNFLLTPIVMWLQKFSLRRGLAVALVMLIFSAVVGGMAWVVAGQLLQVASDLPKYRQNIRNKIEALHLPRESALGRAADSVKEIDSDFLEAPDARNPQAGSQGAAVKNPLPQSPLPQSQPVVPVQVITPPATGLQYL